MTLPGSPSNPNRPIPQYGLRMGFLGGEIGCLTLFIVLVSVIGGLWLDRVLGTKPIITILLVLGSAPLSLVLTYWMAMRAVKDYQSQDITPRPLAEASAKAEAGSQAGSRSDDYEEETGE